MALGWVLTGCCYISLSLSVDAVPRHKHHHVRMSIRGYCFSLIQHNAAPSLHLLPGCLRASDSRPPILFRNCQRTQSDPGSLVHMPVPPALCLSWVQKQEHKKSITKGDQRAKIIAGCIISTFGWQPSPDPSFPGNNTYLYKERSV